jgi:RNA polymerase sigma-70 factor (ECF subfamily)
MSDLRLSIIDNAADWNRYQFDELMILLRKSLSELPEEQRICFEMNRFQDKTYREIARELGISEKTVEYRISQVLKKLQVDLADYLPLLPILVSSLFRSVN